MQYRCIPKSRRLAVIAVAMFLILPARIFASPTTPAGGTQATPALAFMQVPRAEAGSADVLGLPADIAIATFQFAEAASNEGQGVLLDADAISSGAAELPDETPPGSKVPEPASLMLVGSGLLAMSRASRMKRPRWTVSRVALVVMERAVSRKILSRQAA